jgi:selenocysteine lyase/cysteine desulfurase
MIVSTSVNNVSGYELPVEQIGIVAKKHALHFLVDGAQGGGHIPLDMKKQNITMLALAGHKGLGGIMGSGVLIIDDDTKVYITHLAPSLHKPHDVTVEIMKEMGVSVAYDGLEIDI